MYGFPCLEWVWGQDRRCGQGGQMGMLGAVMARKAGTEEGGGRLRGEALESSTSLLLYSCCPPVLGAIGRVLHP